MRLVGQDISVFRGERLVLRGVAFAVAAGGALLLTGPNGAGKSTLLRAIAGLKRLDAGSITFDGDPEIAGRAGLLGHQDAIKVGLSVAENLGFEADRAGLPTGPALEAVGLGALARLPARLLSAGQRRRLAIARLSLGGAPLWLLDEPTLGLDAASVGRFGEMLAAHRARGGVVVAATHLPLPLPGAETLALG